MPQGTSTEHNKNTKTLRNKKKLLLKMLLFFLTAQKMLPMHLLVEGLSQNCKM
jgi:hypothetical protein